MLKYYFFDLGSFNGHESIYMKKIFQDLNIDNFSIHAFEPCSDSYKNIQNLFKEQNDSRLSCHKLAISNKNEKIKLYHSFVGNEVGHSIFSSKNNVDEKNYEEVAGIKFSSWIKSNISDFEQSFNILKSNIEGAEYFLLHQLIDDGLLKNFKIICGDFYDVLKIGTLKEKIKEHEENLCKVSSYTKVNIFPFSSQSGNQLEIEKLILKMKESILYASQ